MHTLTQIYRRPGAGRGLPVGGGRGAPVGGGGDPVGGGRGAPVGGGGDPSSDFEFNWIMNVAAR